MSGFWGAVIGIIGVVIGSVLTFVFSLIQSEQMRRYEEVKYRRDQRFSLITGLIECTSTVNNSFLPPHYIAPENEKSEAIIKQFYAAEAAFRAFWNVNTGKMRLMLNNDAFLTASLIDEAIINIKVELDFDCPHSQINSEYTKEIGRLTVKLIHLVREYTGFNDDNLKRKEVKSN